MFIPKVRVMECARNFVPKHIAQNYKNNKCQALKGKKLKTYYQKRTSLT